tara:strand:+ start:293 stop:1099 length:807 start_codon:yes stop_codon:yes gene_type:complete
MSSLDNNKPIIEVKDLKVHFPVKEGFFRKTVGQIKAVDGVSFKITKGSTVGLVGESGSGKTTIGRSLLRLNHITEGSVDYNGECISTLSNRDFFPYRKKIQMIFQDPFNSLNPRMTIYSIISEPLDIHFSELSKTEKKDTVESLLKKVGLLPEHMNRYPHEFSGGQRQRIGIARALAVKPEFIVCDEAVSALDVSVQAQVVNLLQDLQDELGLTYLFIAHDLAIVEHISDEVLVMTNGKIVEKASAKEIYSNPQHEYTKTLLSAIPSI